MPIDTAEAVRSIPLLGGLPPDELQLLLAAVGEIALEAGDVLFREGEPGDTLYAVIDGALDVVLALGTADEKRIARLGRGELIGEMSLLMPGRLRTASIRAGERSALWMITHRDFDAMLSRHPQVAYRMVQTLTRRLDSSNTAAFNDLLAKNRQLQQAYDELKAAQAQLVEKERLEKELQVAAEIQMSIVPQSLPAAPGFDFGASMVPARAVGGDLYDVFALPGGRIGVVVGDVVGKGVPAAIFMARTHALIMSESAHGGSPGDVLRRVNSHLVGLQQSDRFVTVLFGILDADGRFDYARAGHELPLLLGAGGLVEVPARRAGQPLGLFDDLLLDEQRIDLAPGATLLLYTDGMTDCRSPAGEMYGEERLLQALPALAGASGQQVCAGLLAALSAHRGEAEQDDDITLVALRRAGG